MTHRFKIITFACCLITFFIFKIIDLSAQTTKVLFIGSSLTAANNLPAIFQGLANAADKDVYISHSVLVGHNLTEHLDVTETIEKINQEEWNYIILENGDYGLMSSATRYDVWYTVENFIDIIKTNYDETKIIFFMDWSLKNGVFQDGTAYSYDEYQQKIYDATLEISDSKNLLVAPIGLAWQTIVHDSSELELYAIDGGHPSILGSYLGACVYYSVIFQESVEGNLYYNAVPETDALYLQSIASSTVMDNLELWNLITSVENINEELQINTTIKLCQNYPNPFNPSTTIEFELKDYSTVNVSVHNSLGQRVYTILDKRNLSPGLHRYIWNGKNESGIEMSSGIYLYSLKCGKSQKIMKMVLLR